MVKGLWEFSHSTLGQGGYVNYNLVVRGRSLLPFIGMGWLGI